MSDSPSSPRANGGIARAKALSPESRREIGRKAAQARWTNVPLRATHGDPEHPLVIGDVAIPCYVLEDGTRVLSQSGVVASLGMKRGGSTGGSDRLALFLRGKGVFPFISKELADASENPIRFIPPHGGNVAYGYPATILADICEAVLAARRAGALQPQQAHIADQCEILVRGFARVGIIALIDEATGYERDRIRGSLAKILEAFIAKELQPWVQTFPADFYQEMFRLRGLAFPTDSVRRPQYFGVLTNDIVYKRLAPGVLEELKRVTPKTDSGRPKQRYFQRLTQNVGYPKLREHLGAVVAFMQMSKDWREFITRLDQFRPRYNESMSLAFDYDGSADDGKGL